MYRTRLSAMALIAAGAALGYVAASIDLRVSRSASAASPSDGPAIRAEQSDCCSEGANKSLLLASAGNGSGPGGRRRSASRTSSSSWVTTSAV